jgi:hypothetical protein
MPPIDFSPSQESRQSTQETAVGRVAVLLLADIEPAHSLWGHARFIVQRFAMLRVPGLVFSKVMGSGYDGAKLFFVCFQTKLRPMPS